VYVGAVSILFLFILMLINIRISELSSDNNNSILLVLVAALSLTYTINSTLVVNTFDLKGKGYFANISDIVNEHSLNTILNEGWDNKLMAVSHIKGIGNIMYTTYSLWLIIISVILLLAMVGAIIITINNKQEKLHIY
jgi:NADH-ubiquinone oxidoreductase chain 6